MRRGLMAMLLVVTLVMSCFCSVSAATMTHDQFLDLCKGLATEIEVPVDIAGKLVDGGEYGDKISAKVDDAAAFKAEIDMTNVKNVVKSVLDEAELILSAEEFAKFKDLEVSGEFRFTAKWSGVEMITGKTPQQIEDCFTGIDGIFQIRRCSYYDGVELGVTMEVIPGTKVTKLAELADKIALEITDDYTVIGDGQVEGTLTGWTKIVNPLSTSYDVTYKFVDDSNTDRTKIKPVIIDVKQPGSGGSASTTNFYTLKYETNGGNTYADESYAEGRKVELTKVPEKEGFAFAGWYADAELTNKITSVVMDGAKTVYAAWTAEGEPGGDVAHPVPEILNGEDHIAYIHGYPDGTVRPTANITRAEVAAIFFRLLKDDVRQANLTDANNFADVNDGDWFNTPVSTMTKLGVVTGRTADTFAPNEFITRAEFATICARFDDADEKCEDCNFADIEGHWASDYILEAVAYKWIQGYEDNTFRPDNNITRAEAATLINRVLVRLPEDATCLLEGMKTWPDNEEDAWYYLAIQEATNSHTYGRIDAVNEKWTELTENRDWTVYED